MKNNITLPVFLSLLLQNKIKMTVHISIIIVLAIAANIVLALLIYTLIDCLMNCCKDYKFARRRSENHSDSSELNRTDDEEAITDTDATSISDDPV